MLQETFNPTAGSLEGLAIFLAVVAALMSSRMMAGGRKPDWLILLAAIGLMGIIDYFAAWIVLLITMVLFAGFSMWRRIFRENVNQLLIPIFLIIIAAAFAFYNPSLVDLPKEQVLSQQTSWSVAVDSATDGVKNIVIGSGLGTFHYDFARHKPLEINDSWLWQIRFDRAGSHIAETLATVGFLGLLSYLAAVGLFLVMGYLLMLGIKSVSEVNPLQIAILLAFLALVVGQFVYYQNTVLAFTFWLVLGLSMVSWQKPIKEKVVSFKDFPELSLILSTVIIILGVAVLSLYFFAVKVYLADNSYKNALSRLGPERIQLLEKVVRLNPYSPNYRVALSRTYLYEALREMRKPQNSQNAAAVQTLVSKAIDEARKATEFQPNRVANWENLGVVYREIVGVAGGAADWGIKSFETALNQEPTNPVLYTELGKMYLTLGDTQKAKNQFNAAINVKSDYAEAHVQLALLLEREDGFGEAIARLEGLVAENPFNVDGRFQLGRLYFNDGQLDKAVEQFQIVALLIPDHSNAHYSLGVAYAARGQRQEAIQEFERVLELNPGNQDIIQKLRDLRAVPQQPEQEE